MRNPFAHKGLTNAFIPLESWHYNIVSIYKDHHGDRLTYCLAPPIAYFLRNVVYDIKVMENRVVLHTKDQSSARGFIGNYLKWFSIVTAPDLDRAVHADFLDQSSQGQWLRTTGWWLKTAYHFEKVEDAIMFQLTFSGTSLKESSFADLG